MRLKRKRIAIAIPVVLDAQVAAHPQVDDQGIGGQVQQGKFAAASQTLDRWPGTRCLNVFIGGFSQRTVPQHFGARDRAPRQRWAFTPAVTQRSDDGFDFRKFSGIRIVFSG
jgi:hypothetical protein